MPTHPTQMKLRASVFVAAALGACSPSSEAGLASVNGTQLYYEVLGDGAPVVFLPGGNFDHRMWDDQVKTIGRESRAITYDPRGYGQSGAWGAPYRAADDLVALLDHLGVQRATLVGVSLGARIALDVAAEYPNRVAALVLVAPGLSGYQWSEQGYQWYGPIADAAVARDSLQAARLWLKSPFLAPAMESPALAARLRNWAAENSKVWLAADTEVPYEAPAIEQLGQISVPTLIVVGERDTRDVHRIVDTLAQGILRAEVVRLRDIGHMVHLEAPSRFDELLSAFLGSTQAGGT